MRNPMARLTRLAPWILATLALAGCAASGTAKTVTVQQAAAKVAPGVGGFAILRTERCPTTRGTSGGSAPALSATTTLPLPTQLATGLAAYTDAAGTVLAGPRGWRCRASIGADGSESMSVYPASGPEPIGPHKRSTGEGVAVVVYQSCQGCVSDLVCSLFPSAPVVQSYAFQTCPPKPLRERVYYGVAQTSALFYDPPGVAGQGIPSGGPYPSIGVLRLSFATTSDPYTMAEQASCALPRSRADLCAVIVSAAMAGAAF